MKEVRVVQMFLPHRAHQRVLRCAVLAATALLAAPAVAAGDDSTLERMEQGASNAGTLISAFGQRLFAGDMSAIQSAGFTLAALSGLLGLWLLLNGRRDPLVEAMIDEMDVAVAPDFIAGAAPASAVPVQASMDQSDADRPTRLLEAVAAARAQFDIAVAERQNRTLA